LARRRGAATTAHAATTAAAQTGDVRAALTSDRNARAPTVANKRKANHRAARVNIVSSKTAAHAHRSDRVHGLTLGLVRVRVAMQVRVRVATLVRVQVAMLAMLSPAMLATRKNGAAAAAKAVTARPAMKQTPTIKASNAAPTKDSMVATDMLRVRRSTAIGKNVQAIIQRLILKPSMMQHLKPWAA